MTRQAAAILKNLGTPCIIHQPKYSMFQRWIEEELLDVLEEEGLGCIPFSPLAQGLLTDRYLKSIPAGSRAVREIFLKKADVYAVQNKVLALNEIARSRGQSLAQMALAWILKDKRITSVLIGASSVSQIEDNVESLKNKSFTPEELSLIEQVLAQ